MEGDLELRKHKKTRDKVKVSDQTFHGQSTLIDKSSTPQSMSAYPCTQHQTMDVYISIGTNLGDRYLNITKALSYLKTLSCTPIETSYLYESPAAYVIDQPSFLNCVCKIKVKEDQSPDEFLSSLKDGEKQIGRSSSTTRRGPRIIDMDVVFYGSEVLNTEALVIPHECMHERSFVLEPMCDISPSFVHPVIGVTCAELLKRVNGMATDKKSQESTSRAASLDLVRVLPLPQPDGKESILLRWNANTYIMGVLNVTPDSFSDGGDFFEFSNAVTQAMRMEKDGADFIDIGGQSTRPNADSVTIEEEHRRVIPIIQKLREDGLKTLISIDTFHPTIAAAALDAGANIVNDITACTYGLPDDDEVGDSGMLRFVAQRQVPLVLMHSRGNPKTMNSLENYDDVVMTVRCYLSRRADIAVKLYGIYRWNIIVDPGLGFSKNPQQNISILKHLPKLVNTKISEEVLERHWYPILVGPSRKRFIGTLTDQANARDRDFGTAGACCVAAMAGCAVVRVHNVRGTSDAVRVVDAIRMR